MKHVAEYKKRIVADFQNLIKEYPIIGVLNMEHMPAAQLQNVREQLRETVVMKMTKKKLIRLTFEKAKETTKGIEQLEEYLSGMPALIFTKDNPFKLYKVIKKNKSKAPAKGGQTAPNDILVPAGPTPFAPGPVIGELGQLGIKTSVQDNKIHIMEDKVVIKEGEVINETTAAMLTRLSIKPMEIGLDLVAVFENGTVFTKKVLDVDEDAFWNDLLGAAATSYNLALDIGYFTQETVESLVIKAFSQSKFLAIDNDIITDMFAGEVLAKAEAQASSLKSTANIETPAKATPKAEEKPEEKKEESEKPAEAPAEEKQSEEQPAEEKKEEPAPKKEDTSAETKGEAPAEPEKTEAPKEEVKEELKAEEKPAEEQKKEEKVVEPAPEAEPKGENPAESQSKEELKPEKKEETKVDDKVAEMVEKTKEAMDPDKKEEAPTAEKLVGELDESDKPANAAKETAAADMEQVQNVVEKLQKGETIDKDAPKPDEIPSAHDLAKKKEQK